MLDKIRYINLVSTRGYILFHNSAITKVRLKIGLVRWGKIVSVHYLDVPMRGDNTLSASTGQSPVIMDAEDISAFTINRKFRKIGGAMLFDNRASSNGKYVLEISASKNIGSDDYAGIYITANRAIKITLQASTEEYYDFGYISIDYPVCKSKILAEVSASGTESVSKTISSGESRYIGFFKDKDTSGNDDKVTITIEEV